MDMEKSDEQKSVSVESLFLSTGSPISFLIPCTDYPNCHWSCSRVSLLALRNRDRLLYVVLSQGQRRYSFELREGWVGGLGK